MWFIPACGPCGFAINRNAGIDSDPVFGRASRNACEHSLSAYVFIDVGPTDSDPIADNFVVGAFLRCGDYRALQGPVATRKETIRGPIWINSETTISARCETTSQYLTSVILRIYAELLLKSIEFKLPDKDLQ